MRPRMPSPRAPAPPVPSCAGQAAGSPRALGEMAVGKRQSWCEEPKARAWGRWVTPGSLPGPGAAPWGHLSPLGSLLAGDPRLHPLAMMGAHRCTGGLLFMGGPQPGGRGAPRLGRGWQGCWGGCWAWGVKEQPGSGVWAGLGSGVQSHGDTSGDRAGTFPGARQWLPKENGCRWAGLGGCACPRHVCHVCVPAMCMAMFQVWDPQGSSMPPALLVPGAHCQAQPSR